MARRARARMMELVGVQELINIFETMEREAVEMVNKASEETAKLVYKEVKNNIKSDSGALKRSLATAKVKSRKPTSAFWKVYTKGVRAGGVKYGFHVETGVKNKKKKPDNPYARPGVDKNISEIEMIFEQKLVELLRQFQGGGDI